MSKRILLHVPEELKTLDIVSWPKILDTLLTISSSKNLPQEKVHEELRNWLIDPTDGFLAATVAELQVLGHEVWFYQGSRLSPGLVAGFHGIISAGRTADYRPTVIREESASGYVNITVEDLPQNLPYLPLVINDGKLQIEDAAGTSSAELQFQNEIADSTRQIAALDITISKTAFKIRILNTALKLKTIQERFEQLKKHNKESVNQQVYSLSQCVGLEVEEGKIRAKRLALIRSKGELKEDLIKLLDHINQLPRKMEGRAKTKKDIRELIYRTGNSIILHQAHLTKGPEAESLLQQPIQEPEPGITLAEIKNKLQQLEQHKKNKLDPLSKVAGTNLIQCGSLIESFQRLNTDTSDLNKRLHELSQDVVEWAVVKKRFLAFRKRIKNSIYKLEKKKIKLLNADTPSEQSSALSKEQANQPTDQFSQFTQSSATPVRPLRRAAPSATITSAQEAEQQQQQQPAKRPKLN